MAFSEIYLVLILPNFSIKNFIEYFTQHAFEAKRPKTAIFSLQYYVFITELENLV